MSGWLPPGCTDKDIDDAAPQNEPDDEPELYQCDCCGKMFPPDDLHFVRHDHPNSNAPCDTTVCEKCANPNFPFSGSF